MKSAKRNTKLKAGILVLVQYSLLCVFPFTGLILPDNLTLLIIEMLGVVLGLWAIWTMQFDNLRISPIVKKNSKLIMRGPYKVIRHPMYAAILLTYTPLAIEDPNLLRIVIFGLLMTALIIKLNFEEQLLRNHFNEYENYMKNSYRIIPFIY